MVGDTRRRLALGLGVALAASLLVASGADAQADLAKTLVGTWEGEIQTLGMGNREDPHRTLRILSVTERQGRWVGAGRFGITGKGLGPVDVELRYGDRLGVTGRNGSGKTTLLQALVGEVPLTEGTRRVGSGAIFGELDQARSLFTGVLLEDFVELSALEAPVARTVLAKLALGADDVLRAAASLSPGERTRAALALLVARGVNCLVLDEPTNHLDLEAIAQLEKALASYEGALVVVSHDRRFLDAVGVTRTLAL